MKRNTQSGFSLVELLLVVTIIGIIAALGVPSLQKGIRSAENGAAIGTLRTMSAVQVSFYSRNGRFANLSELNVEQNSSFGTLSGSGTSITRSRFIYEMSPLAPTPDQLKTEYTILATGSNDSGAPFIFKITQTGVITQVSP